MNIIMGLLVGALIGWTVVLACLVVLINADTIKYWWWRYLKFIDW